MISAKPRILIRVTFLNYFALKVCVSICDFQQYCILTSVDSDEPMQPPFKHLWSDVELDCFDS